MKKLILLSILLIVGCDELLDEANDSASQIIFVHAEHAYSYNDYYINETVYEENTDVWGVVISDPMPEFTHLKLNETVFSGDDYSIIYPGHIGFGSFDNDSTARITSNFTPLDVEVKTSQGKVNGTISLPDSIMTLGLSETSNLPLSTPFTISWAGSDADFYSVYFNYDYKDENDDWQYESFEEMTSDNSFTFPGSIFSYNGGIKYIRIQPINGSVPQEGAEGNMSGDGSGFLYYWANTYNYEGDDIIVGSGTNGNGRISNTSTFHPNEQELKQRIRKKIENRILGNEEY